MSTKESVDLVADHGISGQYVVRVLERAAQFRGLPLAIRTDQGPEFTSRQWINGLIRMASSSN